MYFFKKSTLSFTFEMGLGKGVLAIDLYIFIRAKQNDMGGAVLIYIVGQPRSIIIALVVSTHLIGKILDRCKYMYIQINLSEVKFCKLLRK